MSYYRQTEKQETISAGETIRVWDAPTGTPLRRVTIQLSTAGTPTVAGDLDWEVFFGGRWVGAPFVSTSTHAGGVSQASGIIPGGTEILEVVFDRVGSLPKNNIVGSGPTAQGVGATPIILELTNHKATNLNLWITFVTETITDVV